MATASYLDEELRKYVLGAAISKELGYNEELWIDPEDSLTQREVEKIMDPPRSLIAERFSSEDAEYDGWSNLKKELGLRESKYSKSTIHGYEAERLIEILKESAENGKAQKSGNISCPGEKVYNQKDTDLFETYLDAVWLAGLEPQSSWFEGNKSHQFAINSSFRHFTSDNYWSADPELDEKNFDAPKNMLSPYLNPRTVDLNKNTVPGDTSELTETIPNIRIGNKRGTLTRIEQDNLMELFKESEDYLELEQKAEEQGFSKNQVEKMFNPNRTPEEGGSFGRWMDEEVLGNTITFTSGVDNREDHKP